MSGINPLLYMQQLALNLDQLTDPTQLTTILDELEYLYEVIPPEQQPEADQLIAILRDKLQL